MRLLDERADSLVQAGLFAGRLESLNKLAKKCACPSGVIHQALVGKLLTEASAEYSADLCDAYAGLVVKAWKLTWQLEWWREMVRTKRTEVNEVYHDQLGQANLRSLDHVLGRRINARWCAARLRLVHA